MTRMRNVTATKFSPDPAQVSLYASLRTSVNRGVVTDAQLQAYLATFRPNAARPGANMGQPNHPVIPDSSDNSTNLSNSSPAAIWPREEE
jgi:hypothetical protein